MEPYRCGATIEGPRLPGHGRRIVAWRRSCRRIVKHAGDRCWQHAERERKN